MVQVYMYQFYVKGLSKEENEAFSMIEIQSETFLTIHQRYDHLNYASSYLDAKDSTERRSC